MPNPGLPESCGVVIPAYNAEKTLAPLLGRLRDMLPDAQVVVVDDGSRDATASVAEKAGVKVIRHGSNQGKGAALSTGLKQLRLDGRVWAISLDADGQHDVEDIFGFPPFCENDRVGVVVGKRRIAGSTMPWHRRFSNWTTTSMLSWAAGQPVHDAQCGFRMYNLRLLEGPGLPESGRFEWEPRVLVLASCRGYSLETTPVRTLYTDNGSHMRLFRDTLRFLKMYWNLIWTD